MTNEINEITSLSAAIEAYEVAKVSDNAAERLRNRLAETELPPLENAPRMFLAPQFPNSKFLVKAGTPRNAPNNAAYSGPLMPLMAREGDVWLSFSSGVCSLVFDDPDYDIKLLWLEAHSGNPQVHEAFHKAMKENTRGCGAPIGLCHEQGPGIEVWAELKAGQIPTARRAAAISQELDVDAFMRGDHLAKQKINTGAGARMAQTAENNTNAANERAAGNRNSA